jgi:hypothetical protein
VGALAADVEGAHWPVASSLTHSHGVSPSRSLVSHLLVPLWSRSLLPVSRCVTTRVHVVHLHRPAPAAQLPHPCIPSSPHRQAPSAGSDVWQATSARCSLYRRQRPTCEMSRCTTVKHPPLPLAVHLPAVVDCLSAGRVLGFDQTAHTRGGRGSYGQETAVRGGGLQQAGFSWHGILYRARRRQTLPDGGLYQVSCRRHGPLRGARRGQALPDGGVYQVSRGQHGPLQGAWWGQTLPDGGVYQVSCVRRHASLRGAWRGQALPDGGLCQGSC